MRRQDVALVQNFTATTGSIGQSVYDTPDGVAAKVACNVYSLEAELVEIYGLQKVETRALWCDSWPGNLHSKITFEGVVWVQAAPPKTHNKSANLRNVIVPIKRAV